MAARYRRSTRHPSDAQLFFWRYNRGKEVWITESELNRRISNAVAKDKIWKKTSVGRACAKRGWTSANQRHKESISNYYKRPDVKQRRKNRRDSNPEILAKREARLKFRMERAAYRETDEYKEIVRARVRKSHQKRKAEGKTRELDRRRWQNPQHRLKQNLRRMVHFALTRTCGALKAARTFDLIGCSPHALGIFLESQFTPEMSWENYGSYWEVDHKLPLARFDLTNLEQQRLAFHFENLQPLEKTENRKKSDKVEGVSVRKIIPFRKTA